MGSPARLVGRVSLVLNKQAVRRSQTRKNRSTDAKADSRTDSCLARLLESARPLLLDAGRSSSNLIPREVPVRRPFSWNVLARARVICCEFSLSVRQKCTGRLHSSVHIRPEYAVQWADRIPWPALPIWVRLYFYPSPAWLAMALRYPCRSTQAALSRRSSWIA